MLQERRYSKTTVFLKPPPCSCRPAVNYSIYLKHPSLTTLELKNATHLSVILDINCYFLKIIFHQIFKASKMSSEIVCSIPHSISKSKKIWLFFLHYEKMYRYFTLEIRICVLLLQSDLSHEEGSSIAMT